MNDPTCEVLTENAKVRHSVSAFAARMRDILSESRSVSAFARSAGVSEAVVRKWRSGCSDPSRHHLVAISRAANVSLEWLATGEGSKRRDEPLPRRQ
jgi:DNA-binding transcriptional regulator YiaG